MNRYKSLPGVAAVLALLLALAFVPAARANPGDEWIANVVGQIPVEQGSVAVTYELTAVWRHSRSGHEFTTSDVWVLYWVNGLVYDYSGRDDTEEHLQAMFDNGYVPTRSDVRILARTSWEPSKSLARHGKGSWLLKRMSRKGLVRK